MVLPAVPDPRPDDFLLGVVDPDLVAPGHGDQDLLAEVQERPRRAQRDPARRLRVDGARTVPLQTVPGEGGDLERLQIDGAQQVVASVGDVEDRRVARQALRIVERRRGRRAVVRPGAPFADQSLHPAVEVGHHDPVVAAVGDEQVTARDVHLAREAQKGRVGLRIARDVGRARRENPLLPALRDERLDLRRQGRLVDLPRNRLAHVAAGVHQDQRGPGAHREGLPDVVLRIHHDRVDDAVAAHREPDVLGVLLREELGRVHADHQERLLREALLDPAEHGQDVHAVDAAVGPEIEHRHPAAQVVRDGQRTPRVDPGEVPGKLGAANQGGGHHERLHSRHLLISAASHSASRRPGSRTFTAPRRPEAGPIRGRGR